MASVHTEKGEAMTDREKLIELVDDAIIAALDKCHAYEECGSCPSDGRGASCRSPFIADHLIANGVAVREKGEWVRTIEPLGWADVLCGECSNCHESFIVDEECSFDDFSMWHFCPNCGADMRKWENG